MRSTYLLTLGWEKAGRKIDLLQKLCGKYNGNLFFERNFLNLIKREEKNTARLDAVNYGDFLSIFDLKKKNLLEMKTEDIENNEIHFYARISFKIKNFKRI